MATDCGISVQATHGFADAWSDPDVLLVGGGAKPTMDLLGDAAVLAFLAQRGARARWVCSVCTGALVLGAAGLLRIPEMVEDTDQGRRRVGKGAGGGAHGQAFREGYPSLTCEPVRNSVSACKILDQGAKI